MSQVFISGDLQFRPNLDKNWESFAPNREGRRRKLLKNLKNAGDRPKPSLVCGVFSHIRLPEKALGILPTPQKFALPYKIAENPYFQHCPKSRTLQQIKNPV
jgi:hypothetical protein